VSRRRLLRRVPFCPNMAHVSNSPGGRDFSHFRCKATSMRSHFHRRGVAPTTGRSFGTQEPNPKWIEQVKAALPSAAQGRSPGALAPTMTSHPSPPWVTHRGPGQVPNWTQKGKVFVIFDVTGSIDPHVIDPLGLRKFPTMCQLKGLWFWPRKCTEPPLE